jgi:putative FmdB family regulatory protein
MPLYDYKCADCGRIVEIRHGFNETPDETCAACGGRLVRVFNPAPIVFKGSGFYVTDSRKKSTPADKPAESKPEAPAAAEQKTEPAKPAETPKASDSAA